MVRETGVSLSLIERISNLRITAKLANHRTHKRSSKTGARAARCDLAKRLAQQAAEAEVARHQPGMSVKGMLLPVRSLVARLPAERTMMLA
jgi:hypothetical protein